MSTITIAQALTIWFDTLTSLTAKNYISGMKILCTAGLIQSDATLQAFALINHDDIIDRIKNMSDLSESSRQARAACYISFTRFLCRKTQNIINKANPCRDGTAKTFYRVREKVRTQAMTRAQWIEFLQQLHTINPRDCLIAKIILQGGKRMNEVLQLKTDQIDFATGEITFTQSKTKGYEKETVITYPQSVLQELKEYIGSRTGLVFVTSKGHRVMPNQLAVTFSKAGIKANVPFKITPHVLRASTVTYLKREGFADSDIMKVTGHSSATMIHSYDKSERAQNASKKVSLI
ncbi:MAG TPA: site-specific integrase [Candidatus Babeliales bacterium]|nr:site-specific integrase [Candidatus Babeliales bacterium]